MPQATSRFPQCWDVTLPEQSGQRVLIHGGAGGVGHLAIQFAKARGATVCTTVAKQDIEFVRSLGADEAIDYQSERFDEKVEEVDLIFDLVDGETQEHSWDVLKDGGVFVSTLSKPSEAEARKHHAHAVSYFAQPDAAELAEIGRWIDAGKVRPHAQTTYPLKQAGAAQQFVEHEHTQGKVVLEISDR